MNRHMFCGGLIVLSVLPTGCATRVDQAQLASIHSVFLKPIAERHVEVRNPADFDWAPSGSGVSLNEVVSGHGLRIAPEAFTDLTKSLERDGYVVVNTPETADAVVEVKIERAFYNMEPAIVGGGCDPWGLFDVRITNSKTGATIFNGTYRYQSGGGTGVTGDIILDAGSKYNVDDCKALWSNPQIPVDAFRAADIDLADAVARALKKSGSTN